MQQMVKMLLRLDEVPKPDDAADAVAIAICHLQSARLRELIAQQSE
jgi:crossover junction endodeoxyribonuclease RuvC